MTRGWWRALIALLIVADIAVVAYVIRFQGSTSPEPVIAVNADPVKDKSKKDRSNDIVAPLELAGAADGSVLRAMEGSCAGDPARVWLGVGPEGAMEEISIEGLQTVITMQSTVPGWSIVGTDANCEVHEWLSEDNEATTWTQAPTVNPTRWYVDPASAFVLHTPSGTTRLDDRCEVIDVQQAGEVGYVLCEDGTVLRVATEPDVTLEPVASVRGATALHVDGDGRVSALLQTSECAAELAVFSPDGKAETPTCLGANKLGLSVTMAGDTVVVQVGHDLLQGQGGDWVARPEAAA